jgi:predicted nucleic acid-binding protein
MIVVADTSPLNYLILLGKAEVLPALYGRVLAPNAVLVELRHPEAPELVRTWSASPPAWLEVRLVEKLDASLPLELGAGEREAISLALAIRSDLLLIGERAGREQAEARHLQVAGTLAVLMRAAILGLLDFPATLDEICRLGFRVSQDIQAAMLSKYYQARKNNP